MKRLLAPWFCACFLCAAAGAKAAPLRVVIIGDSTVCNYPPANACRGWGQYIEEQFTSGTVRVINLAMTGRSSKTFIRQGLWKKALAEKPDIVLIQFGHNDSHGPGRPESTDPATDYSDYLRRYVDESRSAGAVPILVTPVHRRTFGTDGRLADILQPYADAMKKVAAGKNAHVIDLHAMSGALFTKMGPAGSASFNSTPQDFTHFNEKGARAMADLVMKELPRADPRLRATRAPEQPQH